MNLRNYLFVIIFIGLFNCSSSTESENLEKLLITDFQYFSPELDFVNVLPVLDIDFEYVYHYENSGGQLTNYRYTLRDIKTNSSISSGYGLRFDTIPRGTKLKYIEPNILDTLRYSKIWDISSQDTLYYEFTFKLKGFFCDTSFWQSDDTLNLDTFEHSYADTFLIIQ